MKMAKQRAKTRLRISSLLLGILLTVSCIGSPVHVSAASYSKVISYRDISLSDIPAVDPASLTVMTPSNTQGIRLVAKPDSGSAEPCALDLNILSSANVPVSVLQYVQLKIYYTGSAAVGKRMKIVIPEEAFGIQRTREVYSSETIVSSTDVQNITFNLKDALFNNYFPGTMLPPVRLYPFGNIPVKNLPAGETVKLNTVSFLGSENLSSGTPVCYEVYFDGGIPGCSGTAPDPLLLPVGSAFTLPECPFTREDGRFMNWICSADGNLYAPGDSYTLTARKFTDGNTTAQTYFYANWTHESSVPVTPTKAVSYSTYNDGVVNHLETAFLEKNCEFDGVNTLRVTPNFAYTASATQLALDSWNWNNMPLDVGVYKYVDVVYYLKSANTSATVKPRMQLRFLSKSTPGYPITLTVSFTQSESQLTKNEWAVASFDISRLSDVLNPARTTGTVSQLHFYPFGSFTAKTDVTYKKFLERRGLSDGDELYIADFVFYGEKPRTASAIIPAYLGGYDDGTFRPNATITRAEGAAMLAKAAGITNGIRTGFTDVASSDWYFRYVAALDAKHVFGTDTSGKTFSGDEDLSETDFLTWIMRLKSSYAASYAFEGTKTLTRGRAAYLVSNLLLDSFGTQSFGGAVSPFSDVSTTDWCYNDIVGASVRRLQFNANGGSRISDVLAIGAQSAETGGYDYAAGVNYVAQLDNLTAEKISAIRSAPSEYTQLPGKKIYYVSTSEGTPYSSATSATTNIRVTEATGLTDFNTAVNGTNSKINLNPGDIVLFKRGETFRGAMTACDGVTYSAYGEGEKPLLTRSPENAAVSSRWTLWREDAATGKKVWKYTGPKQTQDVGGITYTLSSGVTKVGLKELCDYKNNAFYMRGTSKALDVWTMLDRDTAFWHSGAYTDNGNSASVPATDLYWRFDAGNPGLLCSDIEFNLHTNCITCGTHSNVTFDNLCIKYFGSHGIGASTIANLTIRNCEIGWGGGAIQYYKNGSVTRFGNGVEIYGGLRNYTIENCYIYEIYDAGITHQYSSSTTASNHLFMENVKYLNNVIEKCSYNIEYFAGTLTNTVNGATVSYESFMKDVDINGNILRMAGYGWGMQRPSNAPSNIKGWTHNNHAINFTLRNNIIDRTIDTQQNATDYLMQLGSTYYGSMPQMTNNVFVQVPGRILFFFCDTSYPCSELAENAANSLTGTGNTVYFYPDDFSEYPYVP